LILVLYSHRSTFGTFAQRPGNRPRELEGARRRKRRKKKAKHTPALQKE